jgi:hypothetical protein
MIINYTVFNPTNCAHNNKYLLLPDVPPSWFSLYRPSSWRSFTNTCNKCCPRRAYIKLKYNFINYSVAKMYKMQINYMYFTLLNFMFSCRKTSMSLLSSSFYGSNISVLCVDVYNIEDHSILYMTPEDGL